MVKIDTYKDGEKSSAMSLVLELFSCIDKNIKKIKIKAKNCNIISYYVQTLHKAHANLEHCLA